MDIAVARAKAKKWTIRVAVGVLVALIVGAAAYTFFTLNFSYSKGERVGRVQKLAKRGWLCKTNEGDLVMANMPGQLQAETFSFTIRDEAVVKQIEDLSGHIVVLDYEEHRGIPSSCFGDTGYFVTSVRKAE